MRGLPLIIVFIYLFINFQIDNKETDSPHGDGLSLGCDECHTSDSWNIDMTKFSFDHDSKTQFSLNGSHLDVSCKECHSNLVFANGKSSCYECHTDIHEQTVGMECERCHTSNSWLVENMTEIHQLSRFPLLGAHNTADCNDCHETASSLRFDPLDTECFSCHREDFYAAQSPNHVEANYSTDCTECHQMNAFSWTGTDINHSFFPLTLGHNISDCASCHQDPNDYGNISSDCISCHENDYNNADEPDHVGLDFSTDCNLCHSTNPGWVPADFTQHDLVFPIYSGEHAGEWNTCTECHPVANNYSIFTCTSCHEHNQGEMDEEHNDIEGYVYEDNACLACHPTGSEEGAFDHSKTSFPLTGAHTSAECALCHTNGYTNTPIDCNSCHNEEYTNTSNPNHLNADINTDCEICHTTDPGWTPAEFRTHDNLFFPIYSGEHNDEWNTCIECHHVEGNYQLFTCTECHDHNQTEMDEEHNGIGGYIYEDNACFECHPTGSGEGVFDHNQSNFPLTGAHIDVECSSCHINGYEGTSNVCFECHTPDFNSSSNPNHLNLGLSTNCEDCHSTEPDWQPASFNIHNEFYQLNGAHNTIANECFECHSGDYNNTPNTCYLCHTDEYNQTNDPPHASAQFSTDCIICHTETAWEPSTFEHDGQYFPIYSGKHNGEWNTCADCHTNSGNYAIFSCIDCHEHNESEMNGEHDEVNGYIYESNACLNCHPDGSEDKTFHPIKIKR